MREVKSDVCHGDYCVLLKDSSILWELGRSAHRVTYKSEHSNLKKTCALRVINDTHFQDEEVRNQLLSDTQSVGSLSHRDIAKIADFGEHDGCCVYAEDFCGSDNLEGASETHRVLIWCGMKVVAKHIERVVLNRFSSAVEMLKAIDLIVWRGVSNVRH